MDQITLLESKLSTLLSGILGFIQFIAFKNKGIESQEALSLAPFAPLGLSPRHQRQSLSGAVEFCCLSNQEEALGPLNYIWIAIE